MKTVDELTEWEPKHPRLAIVGEYLKRVSDASFLGSLVAGDKGKLAETLAYGEPLTTGKGETLNIKPEALELADFMPGKGGVAAVGSLGLAGMRFLGDSKLYARAKDLAATLRKTKPEDWKLQKDIIESTPGFFPIPRGRDLRPELPHAQFGYEIPETKFSSAGMESFGQTRKSASMPIEDLVDSPRLYKAYPGLRNYKIEYRPEDRFNSGFLNVKDKVLGVGDHKSKSDLLETINHELAHYTQSREGWPSGTNVKYALEQFRGIPDALNLPKELRRQADVAALIRKSNVHAPMRAYSLEAGEQMANAEARSARLGGGQISKSYTADPHEMYDHRVLGNETAKYWENLVLQELMQAQK